MYGSCTGRSSDCLRSVSKKDGKRAAALYQALREGRSFELRRSDWKGKRRQILGINSVRKAPTKLAASKLDSSFG